MQTEAETRLAEARVAFIRDREAFERRVSSVFDRLMKERLELAEQHRRLIADRSHLVLVGRRLRKRWHGQRKSAEKNLRQRESRIISGELRLASESAKSQKERASLQAMQDRLSLQKGGAAEQRSQLHADIEALKQQRTALVDFRICVEADCRRADERRNRLNEELRALENRLNEMSQRMTDSQEQLHAELHSRQIANGQTQKVA